MSPSSASVQMWTRGGHRARPRGRRAPLTRRNRDDRMPRLTERERTVLALIAEGKSNQAIAGILFLSEASVEKHITSIFQKLGFEQDESGNRRARRPRPHREHRWPDAADRPDRSGTMTTDNNGTQGEHTPLTPPPASPPQASASPSAPTPSFGGGRSSGPPRSWS